VYWRISAFADLTGQGGLLAGGRWHTAGRPVVYLADTPSSAMLEVLVHLEIDPEDLPDKLRLLRVQVPEEVGIQKVSGLPLDWEVMPEHTRQIGNAWLEAGSSLLLQVPSAIMPHTTNVLFNPRHPHARQASLTMETLELDTRLLPLRKR
jgi:RES domain-containing protein